MDSVKFLRLLAIYVALLGIERIMPSSTLKLVTNALAVAIPLFLFFDYLMSSQPLSIPTVAAVSIALIVLALAGSWAVNGIESIPDFTKMLLSPAFAVLGFNSAAFDRSDPHQVVSLKRLTAILLAVPLLLLALNDVFPHEDLNVISIFANRNNAALYLVGLANTFLLLGVRLVYIVSFLIAATLLFNTIGVLVAVVLTLIFTLSLRRYAAYYLLASVLVLVMIVAIPDLPIVQRLGELAENIGTITHAGLWAELDRLTYLDLYLLTGSSSELSLFFRLKHWQDLWATYLSGDWSGLLFGFGVGGSVLQTDIGLVPHNDYLRFLVETGPLGFVGFTLLSLYLVAHIGRRIYVISTASVALYFLSDNLINNFAAMAMFYFFAGYWLRHAAATAEADAGAQATNLDLPKTGTTAA